MNKALFILLISFLGCSDSAQRSSPASSPEGDTKPVTIIEKKQDLQITTDPKNGISNIVLVGQQEPRITVNFNFAVEKATSMAFCLPSQLIFKCGLAPQNFQPRIILRKLAENGTLESDVAIASTQKEIKLTEKGSYALRVSLTNYETCEQVSYLFYACIDAEDLPAEEPKE